MKLSTAQTRALLFLVRYPVDVWVSGTPVTQKCLSVLKEKGLVKVALDDDGWHEMITDKGREVSARITRSFRDDESIEVKQ